MSMIRRFFRKWAAFFRPVEGWKKRFLLFRGGVHTWEVPGLPEKSKVVPFPVQWIPHRMELTDEDDEASHTRGFVFLDVTCSDSGKDAPAGVGVLCLRCGLPLHPTAAHMVSDFNPPYCRRCKWPLKLA